MAKSCLFALFAHMMSSISAGQMLPQTNGCLESSVVFTPALFTATEMSARVTAVLPVVCGRCVKTASNMFIQPMEIKLEPSCYRLDMWKSAFAPKLHICFGLFLDVVAQVICKLAKVVNVSGPRLCLLSQRVSEGKRI